MLAATALFIVAFHANAAPPIDASSCIGTKGICPMSIANLSSHGVRSSSLIVTAKVVTGRFQECSARLVNILADAQDLRRQLSCTHGFIG